MKIYLFTLDKEHKRRLIEIMLVIFSLIVVISSDKVFDSGALGVMPSVFLFMSIFYWIALDQKKIFSSHRFKLIAFIISLTFSVMLSMQLLLFFPNGGIISEILFWAYYIIFTFVIFIALVSNEDDFKGDKWYLKPLGQIIFIILFVLVLFLLSKLF